jgi:hypothetical protein
MRAVLPACEYPYESRITYSILRHQTSSQMPQPIAAILLMKVIQRSQRASISKAGSIHDLLDSTEGLQGAQVVVNEDADRRRVRC